MRPDGAGPGKIIRAATLLTDRRTVCRRCLPTFEALRRKLARHVEAFARAVEWDLRGRKLEMTDCWVNIMPHGTVHTLHLHPHSTLSGTYYVQVPKGSPGIKFEDPRLDRFMAAPRRAVRARRAIASLGHVQAAAGSLVLFESWLRHEVAPNAVKARANQRKLQLQLVLNAKDY